MAADKVYIQRYDIFSSRFNLMGITFNLNSSFFSTFDVYQVICKLNLKEGNSIFHNNENWQSGLIRKITHRVIKFHLPSVIKL